MQNDEIENLKKNIITIGRLLWEKELTTALSGNMSARVDDARILITATRTCLGLLHEKDVLLIDWDGQSLEEGQPSTEKLLHTEIYKRFPNICAVVHTHAIHTNAYFLANDLLKPRISETEIFLGDVVGLKKNTTSTADVEAILRALKTRSVLALKKHGGVAVGKNLFDCFVLLQCLEDAAKIDMICQLYKKKTSRQKRLQKRI